MFNKLTKPLAVVILVILILLISKSFSIFKNSDLENNLTDIDIEKLTLRDQDYEIKKGKVYKNNKPLNFLTNTQEIKNTLALASYYINEKEDPLFYSDNLAGTDFLDTINLLEEVQQSFINEKLLTRQIYPIDFLKSTVTTSNEYLNLKDKITFEHAQNLINVQKETNSKYLNNANNLNAVFADIAKDQGEFQLIALDTTTTVDIIQKDIKKIIDNSQNLSNEIDARENCLKQANCKKRIKKQDFQIPNFRFDNNPELLPNDVLTTQQYANEQRNGPFLVTTRCFGDNKQQTHYPFLTYSTRNGLRDKEYKTVLIKNGNEVVFRKLNEIDPIDRKLISQGISWNWFAESNSYVCWDLTYQPLVATMLYYSKTYSSPILDKININIDLNELESFEKQFYEADIISEENFVNLGAIYKQAYLKLVENNKTNTDVPQKNEILNRYLTIDRRIQNIEKIINQSLYALETNLVRDKIVLAEEKVSPNFFLNSFITTRAQYSIYFFPYTKTFWRNPESLTYISDVKVETKNKDQTYMTLSKAKESFSESEVKKWYVPVLDQIKSFNKSGN